MKREPKVKPVRAWALVDEYGYLYAPTCDWSRMMVMRHTATTPGRLRAIKVEIRPAPKRKKAKP